jgi:fructose 1,6-bisphosphate aldolase/phosphatase
MPRPKITLSVIKADVGGFVGHTSVHPALVDLAGGELARARDGGALEDFQVLTCGDDLELILTHHHGPDARKIHALAWDVFVKAAAEARKLKLYGAGQDLLKDSFSGNVKGMGPGVAEMEFEERPSEPVVVFMADKTAPGAWNLPLFKMFADGFNTAGLIIDITMHGGFRFEVLDVKSDETYFLDCPEQTYDLLALLGSTGHYVVKSVRRRSDGEVAAVASTTRLSLIAGKYVGKDDPVLVVRSQSGFPAIGEIVEPFSQAHMVSGWMRGSHNGPLMPCSFAQAHPTRFDGPPRVMAAGFQLAGGRLLGPRDLFDDPSFDLARQRANEIADYLRRHGPFEPHRLPEEDMEYTTLPRVIAKLRPVAHAKELAAVLAGAGTRNGGS